MPNLRDIRNRITSVNNTQQITKAMKMVAAAKLRRAQDRIIQTRPYAAKLQDVVSRLATGESISNPLLEVKEQPNKILLIVVGSDRGLCGGFNNNLFKEVEQRIQQDFSEKNASGLLSLITIGKKATAHFSKRKYDVIESYPGFFDNLDYDATSTLMRGAADLFTTGEFDEVHLAYNEFKSVIAQTRKIDKILPIDPKSLVGDNDASQATIDYIYEPNSEAIIDQLLPLHLNTQLWKAVLESNASEQGARMTAMDSATENAKDLERDLRLKYNQARQSAITTEISEIVSGAQALGDS